MLILIFLYFSQVFAGFVPTARVFTRDFSEYPLIPPEPNPETIREKDLQAFEEFARFLHINNTTEREKRNTQVLFLWFKPFLRNFHESTEIPPVVRDSSSEPPIKDEELIDTFEYPDTDVEDNFNPPPKLPPRITLDYKPMKPFYYPLTPIVGQIIPPGPPWPASQSGYANFSVIPKPSSTSRPSFVFTDTTQQTTLSPSLIERFPELTTISTPIPPKIVLDYKPSRPFYAQSPTIIGQIIPAGKPWPASADGYANFSVTRSSPRVNSTTTTNRPDTTTLKLYTSEVVSVPEPNALSYRRPIVTTQATHLFTSGTRQTTISDIRDIIDGTVKVNASHLLPFDVDDKNLNKPRPLKQAPTVKNPVYTGFSNTNHRELVLPNPKFKRIRHP